MKIFSNNNSLTVILNDGTILSKEGASVELISDIFSNQNNEEYVKSLLVPKLAKKMEEAKEKNDILDFIQHKSKILSKEGASIYMKKVSELSIPEDLILAIVEAEKNDDKDLLESYINFWTLASLNPDSRARTNLFWFLNRYGMKISKSGLFVAYRAVEIKQKGSDISVSMSKVISEKYFHIKTKLKKSPKNYYLGKDSDGEWKHAIATDRLDSVYSNKTIAELYNDLSDTEAPDTTIYTDQFTKTMEIVIGKPVFMDRNKCDATQENTCSRGLHVAGKDWLKNNSYFGKVKLMVLVNPADVVAVPPRDDYGKMRTCAYYPVKVVEFDGDDLDNTVDDGFEDDFMNMITYDGNINNEEVETYHINIPNIPELNSSNINNRLSEMRSKINKNVN